MVLLILSFSYSFAQISKTIVTLYVHGVLVNLALSYFIATVLLFDFRCFAGFKFKLLFH